MREDGALKASCAAPLVELSLKKAFLIDWSSRATVVTMSGRCDCAVANRPDAQKLPAGVERQCQQGVG
ncbi:hypothetical protein HLH89_33020 [Rhizobium laguerreae]|uniref:hypothetical protein n=1 Tax=Rhizobium laguerreae TaxID=1076926 RepID=UPI001479810E|nr:hypothetical protein [Rhizobium laguerreae]NNH85775.1 hypothetical protein [Rhizobium laguerreae]